MLKVCIYPKFNCSILEITRLGPKRDTDYKLTFSGEDTIPYLTAFAICQRCDEDILNISASYINLPQSLCVVNSFRTVLEILPHRRLKVNTEPL